MEQSADRSVGGLLFSPAGGSLLRRLVPRRLNHAAQEPAILKSTSHLYLGAPAAKAALDAPLRNAKLQRMPAMKTKWTNRIFWSNSIRGRDSASLATERRIDCDDIGIRRLIGEGGFRLGWRSRGSYLAHSGC